MNVCIDDVVRWIEDEEPLVEILKDVFSVNAYNGTFDNNIPVSGHPVKKVAVYTRRTIWTTGHCIAVFEMAKVIKSCGCEVCMILKEDPPQSYHDEGMDIFIMNGEGTLASQVKELHNICAENDIDTVIMNSWLGDDKYWDLLAIYSATKITGKRTRLVLHFHNAVSMPAYRTDLSWHYMNSKFLNLFDAVITTSQVDKVYLDVYNSRTYFRNLPVRFDIAESAEENRYKQNVVYLARYCSQKSQIKAIRAFRHVVDELPDSQLHLVGDSIKGYKEKCQELVERLGLEGNVQLHDYMEGEDLKNLLCNTGIGISTARFEGYCMTIAEQKCHGVPIVTFDLPNLKLLDGGESNGVVITEQDDLRGFADQIIRLLKDDELRVNLGKKSIAHMERLAKIREETLWSKVFDDITKPTPSLPVSDAARLWSSFYYAWEEKRGLIQRQADRIQRQQDQIKKQTDEIKKLKKRESQREARIQKSVFLRTLMRVYRWLRRATK